MASPVLVLAHAPHAQATAQRISHELADLGFSVDGGGGSATRRAQAARIEAAGHVVVLWSRGTQGTPALRAALRRARAKGTLLCFALDGAPSPAGVAHRLPRSGGAWRKALSGKRARKEHAPAVSRAYPRPAKARRDAKQRVDMPLQSSRLTQPRGSGASLIASLTALALVAAAAGAEAYAYDPAFAARVSDFAGYAQALAAQLEMQFAAQR